ncbi:hypothetical protein CCR75_008551 [Bremia lactucae]|uniref:Thioredoxin domain-containing protein n=1 Tax=Bremia lactucae TaxID=4779 RepID=A0A976FPS6_BRELC|nr:hypothetical protein CCR75_008551 [Bremia lactucae]
MIRKLFHVPVVLRDSRTFFSGLRSRVTVIASDEAYSHIAKEGTGRKAIVYFTAKWCPPCKIIGPIYDELSRCPRSTTLMTAIFCILYRDK